MRRHPVFPAGLDARRRRLLSHARGRVLELGVENELNLPHYYNVESVEFIEVDDVAAATATYDTVVSCFELCRVDDVDATLRAIAPRLAPDGRFLFLEHVAGTGLRFAAQRVVSPPWRRMFSGCRPDRDTVAAVRDAGFLVTDLDRFTLRLAAPMVSPAVQAVARPKPAS